MKNNKKIPYQHIKKQKDKEKSEIREHKQELVKKFSINNYILLGLLLLAVLLLFFPVVGYDFVNWDDQKYVYENPYIALNWENVRFYFTNYYFLMYLPVTLLTLSINHDIGGLNPAIYHFTNILFHLINTGLVFWFIFKLFDLSGSKRKTDIALIVAALFGLHTMHVESVVWIAERKDVVYTVFYFATLISYLYYIEKKKIVYLLLSFFLFFLSLISKAQAMPLAAIVVTIDFLLNRKLLNKKIILEKIPFFILACIFGVIAILATRSQGTEKVNFYPFFQRIFYASYAYSMYIIKLIVPFNLSAIVPFPQKPGSGMPFYIYFFSVPVLATIGYFIYALRKNVVHAFGIAFFTISIILVLQLFSYHNVILADRYTYVSAVGIFIVIGCFYQFLTEKFIKLEKLIILIFVIYIGFITFLSYKRLPVWKNSISLWNDVLSKHDNVTAAFYNRGVTLFESKNFDLAMADFNKVIAYDPNNAGGYFSRANTWLEKGDLAKSLLDYDKAVQLDSTRTDILTNRGIARAKNGDIHGSIADFNKAIQLDPNQSNAYSNRGNSKTMLQDWNGAIQDYNKAVELKPNYLDAIFNRGLAKYYLKDYKASIADMNLSIQLKADNAMAWFNRGTSYYMLDSIDQAVRDFDKAIQFNPSMLDAYYNRGNIRLDRKDFKGAIQDYDLVIKMLPNNALPYEKRGTAKIAAGLVNEACADFKKSYQLGNAKLLPLIQKYCK